jgi:hypothetical protein
MLLVSRHAGTPSEALSKLMKSSRLDFADLAILVIVLGIECVCAGVVVTLFVVWLMSLNNNRFATSGSECARLGRGGIQCAQNDDPTRRLDAERKLAPDCLSLGRGGRLCSPALN